MMPLNATGTGVSGGMGTSGGLAYSSQQVRPSTAYSTTSNGMQLQKSRATSASKQANPYQMNKVKLGLPFP